jgi:predicted DNA-binding transcriptional regulator AlpA
MAQQDEYITVQEAIAAFGRTKSWWYDRINDGDLTAYEVGADPVTRLSRKEIEQFLGAPPRPKGQPRRRHVEDAG